MNIERKTIRNKPKAVKSGNRLLRLLRPDAGVRVFLVSLEKTGREEEANKDTQKEIQDAMLEAEYKKAKAIMDSQQHRSFC